MRKNIQDLIEWKPDIIHTNTEFSTYTLAKDISRKTGAPMVHTYHTDYEDYVHYLALSKKMGTPLVKSYIKHVTSYMQEIIAPTEKTKQQLLGYGISTKITVIPTGLDLTKYNAPPELSWMLADYIKNGNKSWVNVLNAHIQQTAREVRFAIADLPTPRVLRVDAGRFAIDNYPIELNQTVEDINWEDEGSINYIVNPFDKDVHTNVRALYELLW